jgi:hypothetical protein
LMIWLVVTSLAWKSSKGFTERRLSPWIFFYDNMSPWIWTFAVSTIHAPKHPRVLLLRRRSWVPGRWARTKPALHIDRRRDAPGPPIGCKGICFLANDTH